MKLSTCIHQFFNQYLNRVKGCRKNTIKAYRETFTLFLPFAADYHQTKVSSLYVDHLTIDMILDFLDQFTAKNGSTVCKELLGYDISSPEDFKKAEEAGLFETLCPRLIQSSVEIIEKIL